MANPLKKTTQPPRNDEQKRLIRDRLVTEISEAIPVMMLKRDEATYRQLALTISAFTDTVNLLDGLPKGIQEVAPALNEIMEALEKLNWNRTEFFDDMRDELRLALARKRLSDDAENIDNTSQSPRTSGLATNMDTRRPPQADRAAQGASAAGDAP